MLVLALGSFFAGTAVASSGGSVKDVSVALSPGVAAASADYTVSFVSPDAIPAGGTITLLAPGGTLWPTAACDYSLVDLSSSAGSFLALLSNPLSISPTAVCPPRLRLRPVRTEDCLPQLVGGRHASVIARWPGPRTGSCPEPTMNGAGPTP